MQGFSKADSRKTAEHVQDRVHLKAPILLLQIQDTILKYSFLTVIVCRDVGKAQTCDDINSNWRNIRAQKQIAASEGLKAVLFYYREFLSLLLKPCICAGSRWRDSSHMRKNKQTYLFMHSAKGKKHRRKYFYSVTKYDPSYSWALGLLQMGHINLHKTDQAVFKLLQKLKGTLWCKAKQLQAVRLLGEVTTVMKAKNRVICQLPHRSKLCITLILSVRYENNLSFSDPALTVLTQWTLSLH